MTSAGGCVPIFGVHFCEWWRGPYEWASGLRDGHVGGGRSNAGAGQTKECNMMK